MKWRDNLSPFLGLIMLFAGYPVFLVIYKATKNLRLSIVISIFYEAVILIGGFISKILKRLEEEWTESFAEWINRKLKIIFSRYRRRYLKHLIYRYRSLDVKGILIQGPYDLELTSVYVQLRVDPISAHNISSNPIQALSEDLRSGNHLIWQYLSETNNFVKNYAILGPAGSGKTTMLRHMALTLADSKHRRRGNRIPNLLPILLFLRDHATTIKNNKNIHLAQLIQDQFESRQAPIPPKGWIEHQLNQGKCLIMLDGLDEIADENTHNMIVSWLEQCMEAYGKNTFIITSRPHGFKINPLAHVTVLGICRLTTTQIEEFVRNWYIAIEIMSKRNSDLGVREEALGGATDLLDRIWKSETLSALSVNPLLLTMIAYVHRYQGRLPEQRVELYSQIFDVFLRNKQLVRGLDLPPQKKIKVLHQLAYFMMKEKIQEISKDKAINVIDESLKAIAPDISGEFFLQRVEECSGLLIELERNVYGFTHLTFQEYLASLHIIESRLEDELISQVNSPWWRETIRLYCAQTDASRVILSCLESFDVNALGLAIDCMEEYIEVSPLVRKQFEETLKKNADNPDIERHGLIASALLKRRIG